MSAATPSSSHSPEHVYRKEEEEGGAGAGAAGGERRSAKRVGSLKLVSRSTSQSGPLSPVSEDGGPPHTVHDAVTDAYGGDGSYSKQQHQQHPQQQQQQQYSRRDRSDSQASGSSSAISSSGFESGYDSRTTDPAGSSATFSRTTATEGDAAAAALRALQHQQQQTLLASLHQPARYTPLSHLVYPSQQRQLTALARGVQQQQQQGSSGGRRHASLGGMSTASPFSSPSGQRHSSFGGGGGATSGGSPFTTPTHGGSSSRMMSPSELAAHMAAGGGGGSGSPSSIHSPHHHSHHSHHPQPGSAPGSVLSFAAAGMHFNSSMTPFQPDNNARMAYLDESGLSPDEFAFYLPALLGLKESPSGVDGLYDEQDALRYLREECGIELRDEAMIMALFERTPLGIKPGHFFAWLRLASWAQQGQMPTKALLFTQTQPARTASMRKASGRQTARPMMHSSQTPSIAISNSLGEIRRESGSAEYHISPRHPSIAAFQQHHGMTASPPPPPPNAKGISRQGHHSRMGSLGGSTMAQAMVATPSMASSTKPVPALPGADMHKASNNPFGEPAGQHQAHGGAPGQHPPYTLPPSQTFVLQHAAPALPTPAPPRDPSPGKLPIDALLGFDPSPNPFKQNKPRIVRPTPVVATSSASVANPFRNPHGQGQGRERGDSGSAKSIVSVDRERARDGHSTWGDSYGASLRKSSGDRLPPPLPPRAGISPLIQAGLEAASSVQRAKQALPPKTYKAIQRSATAVPSKGRRAPNQAELRLLTGEVAPPEVVAPLAQRAAERDAELFAGRRKPSLSTTSGTQRRSISEAATMMRKHSSGDDYEEAQPRRASLRTTSTANRSTTRSPEPLESNGGGDAVTSRRLARLPDAEDESDGRQSQKRGSKKSSVPDWLQEQDEIQRREGSPPSPIPEDIALELDSPRDEISENAMSAASIERPGNPFSHRTEEPPPPIMKDRPLGRSKTLSNRQPPPAPPRKRNESFPASSQSADAKATFKKGASQQRQHKDASQGDGDQQQQQSRAALRVQRLSKTSSERPSPIEEDLAGEKAAKNPSIESLSSAAKVGERHPSSGHNADDKEARKSLVDHADAVDDEFHDADADVASNSGDRNGYARLD